MKWRCFEVPVKVEQLNEYLISDTVQSQQKTRNGSDEISQGQYRGYPLMQVLQSCYRLVADSFTYLGACTDKFE